VDRAALEEAVNQQVIHGGCLDTLLLEAGVVDEATLVRALAAASQTSPVEADRFAAPVDSAVQRLPRRMAVAMGLVPLFVDDTSALHVGCGSPLDRDLIDEVADLLKTTVVPHVVPEARLRQGLHAAYGHPLEERFVALLRRLHSDVGVGPDTGPMPGGGAGANGGANDPIVNWDLSEALAHLAAEDSRDGIARVAVAFARRFLPFAAVFGVRDGHAIGWLRQGPFEGVQFARPFPIPPQSFLGAALRAAAPALVSPDAIDENAAVFGWLGRRRPQTALVVPIVVARRPVGVLFGDGGVRHRDPRDVAELTAFAARLGAAFEALLRQRHRQHPSIFPQPAVSLPPTTIPTSVATATDTTATDTTATTLPPEEVVTLPPITLPPITLPPIALPPIALPPTPPPDDDDDDLPAPPPLATLTMATLLNTLPTPLPTPLPTRLTPHPTWSADIDDIPHDAVSLDDDLPAPPPLPATRPVSMSASRTSMPTIGARLDGTSPFAHGYRPPALTMPPPFTGMGGPLHEHLPRVTDDEGTPSPDGPTEARPFYPLPEATAPEAWRGALHATVERGLQGGTVIDDDLDWEDVVYDPAHTRLERPVPPPVAPVLAVDFPALSSSVLHDLYDGDGNAVGNDSSDKDSSDQETRDADDSRGVEDEWEPTAVDGQQLPSSPLPSMSHADLVEVLFDGDENLVERASRELVARGLAAVPALGERFPGRLRVDPFDPGENVRTADRLGPLIEVLARLGRDGLDAAVPHVDSRYPVHRFAAVLLFALSPDVRAVHLLRNRLHDAEPRIQRLATEALVPFLAHPRFEGLLVHLRERALATTRAHPFEARRRAAELLGEFRDVGAVPLLMNLLSLPELQEVARRALRAITLVDHGTRSRGWEKWWARGRKRSRIDWLIDGLGSEELELRSAAWRELAALVGDDFGYRPDADKRSRQRAIEVWQQWWQAEQQQHTHPKAAAKL
jgi:hypothetical protein